MKRILAVLLSCLLLCGCGEIAAEPSGGGTVDPSTGGAGNSSTGGTTVPAGSVDFSKTDEDMFTDRDLRGDWETPIQILLTGDGAQCDSPLVAVEGSTVVIRGEGVYLLTGQLTGSLQIAAGDSDKIQLVLSGARIENADGPAIHCQTADKLFVTLAENTENSLVSQGEAALLSRCDLTLNGTGRLTVTAENGHGITGKDDLAITGGVYDIVSANQAIDANDSVRICGGTFTLRAGKDGIHAENAEDTAKGFVYISGGSFDIEAQGDGVSASATLQITAGDFQLLCGGGYENGGQHSSDNWGMPGGDGGSGGGWPGGPRSGTSTRATAEESTSMKGLKAGPGAAIDGGSFSIDAADDALHSDGSLTVNGGTFEIYSGDDAIHAEEDLIFTGGTVTVSACYEGLEGKNIYVRGGDFLLHCDDDGLNASGGSDGSGYGGRDNMFGMPGGSAGTADCSINVSGGSLRIYSGGDGLDSNGNLTISGGYTYVTNPKSGDVSVLDSDRTPTITGGTYIGLGISTNMAQTFGTSSTQGVLARTVGTQAAGTVITLTDSSGREILSVTTEYTTVLMIVSTPEMVKGESYTVTAGQLSGTLDAS